MRDKKIYTLAESALLISLLVAVSYFVIPLPPSGLSLMTVAVNLIALMLSPLQAASAIGVYLLMGLIGLPVFSGGVGGAGKLFGVTGGYYFGFLIAVMLMSLLKGKRPGFIRYSAVTACVGVPIEHLCAVLVMCLHNGFDIRGAFVTISLPFIAGDVIKAIAAAFLGTAINKRLSKVI